MNYGGHWHTLVIAIGAVALVIAAGTVVILTVTSAPVAAVSLDLTIEFNPASWYLNFNPTTFQAPANTVIQFTITNYDPTTRSVAPTFCNVTGTVGQTMEEMLQGSSMAGESMMRGLAPSGVSHTFTMISGVFDLNVPIPPAPSAQLPIVVVFSFETPAAGVFAWTSEATITGPHGASGAMTGFFNSN